MRSLHPAKRPLIVVRRALRNDCATQIAEFAVSLPLLVLFVVGIFDFSGAVTLKQKLTNAAREGARVAAADPANDLGNSSTAALPVSV
ncbi:MAG: TadE/TadG family type IV pilus assembly protein, partial [Candidatus Sulfotelmatobacter sp.]